MTIVTSAYSNGNNTHRDSIDFIPKISHQPYTPPWDTHTNGNGPAIAPRPGASIETNTLAAALAYTDAGLFVLPLCWPNRMGECGCFKRHKVPKDIGKAPLLGKGYEKTRLTRAEVIDWWTRYPHANVGIMLQPSGFLVIDSDSEDADQEVERLGIPPGPRAKTPRGIHRYFRNESGIYGRTTKKGESHKVDVLSLGYVVAAPSRTPAGVYTWEVALNEQELADPPQWALKLLTEQKAVENEIELPEDLVPVDLAALNLTPWVLEVIRTGQPSHSDDYPSRSEAVFAVETALLKAGCSVETIASILLDPRYRVSEKPREQGPHWLAGDIARAQARVKEEQPHLNGITPPPEFMTDGREEPDEKESYNRERMGEKVKHEAKPATAFKTYTARSLEGKELPEPKEVVPGILVEGLNFLVAPPKIGKSWLALNIACAVAQDSGGLALGKIPVESGDVLLLALEDSPRRLQGRIEALSSPGAAWPERLHITHESPKDGGGLVEAVEAWLTEHPHARLVIIDTLGRVRNPKRRGADCYQEDYATGAPLQALALKHHVAILVIHHTKKGKEDDFVESISGTNGLGGSADTTLALKRGRGQANGILSVTGRDVREGAYALSFLDGLWQLLGDAEEFNLTPERRAIIEALRQAGKSLPPKEIAAAVQKNGASVRKLLEKMARTGEVRVTAFGLYTLPTSGHTTTNPYPPSMEEERKDGHTDHSDHSDHTGHTDHSSEIEPETAASVTTVTYCDPDPVTAKPQENREVRASVTAVTAVTANSSLTDHTEHLWLDLGREEAKKRLAKLLLANADPVPPPPVS